MKEDFEKYIKESIGEHIKDVLKNPKQNLGSVGFIAGVSNCIKYLTPETVTSIVDGLEENKFLKSNNFNEIIPLCIPILENFSSKFDSRQKEKMHKICIDDAKAAKSKSKKMYLALQCLFSKDERAKDLENNTLEKFNAKAFLNNKSLAKLFIRSFIRIYYDHKDNESEKGASNELEMLIQVLTKKQKLAGSQSLKRIQIINYILTQILSYDILKQGFSSFENMKAYSLIFESFQGAKNDEEGDESTVKVQSARQINFFLKIYENSLSYLSQYSSDSLVTSLNLILSSARMSNLFSSSPKFYEYKIIDTLYYCAVVSYSQEIIDVIFNELEYIAIKLIESGQSLIPIANSIRRHMIALRLKDMKYYISVSLVNLMSKILEHFVKENYADISRERNINFMRKISTLFTPIIIPVVRSIDSVMNENITGYKDQEVIQGNKFINNFYCIEFKNSLATPIRNIWGCALIFKGFSEKDTEFASIFDPFEFYSIDLMQLAYFITPPLINPSKGTSQNSL